MLERQSTSLFHRVIKGKCFHFTSFSNAKIGSNPSYGWQSILEGREVLTKGLLWRIGTGEFMDCRCASWLPTSLPFKAICKAEASSNIRWVSQLIDRDHHYWKEDLVCATLELDIVNEILSIPCSVSRLSDRLIGTTHEMASTLYVLVTILQLAWSMQARM